jgi:hypothetical protein
MSFVKSSALPLVLAIACNAMAATPAPQLQSPERLALAGLDVGQLKVLYLECAARSEVERMDLGDVIRCSFVHEELMQRGFDGSFTRLLAWWQAHKTAVTDAVHEPVPTP